MTPAENDCGTPSAYFGKGMSQNFSQPGNSLDSNERRQHPRHQLNSLAYLDIGPDNGGIILNISEGGLALHAVGVLPPEPVIELRIQFSKSTKRLETTGKVAWTSGSKKDAGIEFVDLPEEDYQQIKQWLSAQNQPDPLPAERKPKPELAPPPNKRRTDKWIKLAADLPDAPVGIGQESAGVRSEPHEQKLDDKIAPDETPPSEPLEPHPANHPDLGANNLTPAASLPPDISGNGRHQEAPPASQSAHISPSAQPESRFFVSEVSLPETGKDSPGAQHPAASHRPADDFLTRARAVLSVKRRAGEKASKRLLADWTAATQDFWSRSSVGTLTVLAVAAILCLGLGIEIGRSMFKPPASKMPTVDSAPPAVSQAPPAAPPEQSASDDASDSNLQPAHRRLSNAKSSSHHNAGVEKRIGTPDQGADDSAEGTPAKPANDDAALPPAQSSAKSAAAPAAAPVQAPVSTPLQQAAQPPSPEFPESVPATGDTAPRALAPPDRLLPSYLIYRVAPAYPQEAIDQKIEGTVKIHLIIGRNGRVKNLRVVGGPQILHQAALDAAAHWRYIPALRNGEPIETEEEITVVFRLPQ
ncbi:MAG: TonB family protein [Candidatus Acidiferrales bacterium]